MTMQFNGNSELWISDNLSLLNIPDFSKFDRLNQASCIVQSSRHIRTVEIHISIRYKLQSPT